MAKLRLAAAIRRLNLRYGTNWTYQQGYMAAIAALIPAERDETDRFWLIDESNMSATRKALGQIATKKPAGKRTAKPKPAAKPAKSKPAASAA
jgi:hypothetical protein